MPVQECRRRPRSDPPVFELTSFADAYFSWSTGSSTGGVMVSGSSNGPTGTAQYVLIDLQEISPPQIETYLSGEPDLFIPIPFLDGIFRPPQA